jgi:hypothetical protein
VIVAPNRLLTSLRTVTTDAAGLQRRKQEVAARWGPWTAHNVHLGHGVFTIGPDPTEDDVRNFTLDTFGEFDAVLCTGLLYHLEERVGPRATDVLAPGQHELQYEFEPPAPATPQKPAAADAPDRRRRLGDVRRRVGRVVRRYAG